MNEMVAAGQKRAAGQADAPLLPLVRLRVDYTGFSTINAQRFGQRFVGRVANPHDLLLFQKAPVRKPKVWYLSASCSDRRQGTHGKRSGRSERGDIPASPGVTQDFRCTCNLQGGCASKALKAGQIL